MPAMLKLMFVGYNAPGLELQVDIPDLLTKLVITILAPSIIGKVGLTREEGIKLTYSDKYE